MKKYMRSQALLAALLCGFFAQSHAVENDDNAPRAASRPPLLDEKEAISVYGHIDTDFVSNLKGGIERGKGIDSVAVGGITLSGKRFGLAGSSFNLSGMALYSNKVNEKYIGGITNPSNIEGDFSRLVLDTAFWQQNWLMEDQLGLSTRVGMFDLNSEFNATESAAQFINSSFGMDPSMTENFTVSTFPKNGSGVFATLANAAHTEDAPLAFKLALFQGDVDTQDRIFSQGLLSLGEAQWRPIERSAFKLGLWEKHGNNQPSARGGYLSAEGRVWQQDESALDIFLRAGLAKNNAEISEHTRPKSYYSAGLSLDAPFPSRSNDMFILGFAHLQLEGGDVFNRGHERIFEIGYVARISEHLYLQPDLQYIQSPGGEHPDAWVGILRLHLE